MTAHRQKPVITRERVEWFAAYYKKYPSWGSFHVVLDDANYDCSVDEDWSKGEPGEDEAIEWFNELTESQKERLGRKAQDLANTVVR